MYNDPNDPNQPNQQPNQLLTEEQRLLEEERRIAAANQRVTVEKVVQGIYYLTGALGILLLLRVFLRLFGANPSSVFANVIYDLSSPFVAPFANLFKNPTLGSQAAFEINTLVAIGVYALLCWLVVRFVVLIWG